MPKDQLKFQKPGEYVSENGRPEIFAENGGFPAETGGLESLRNKLWTKVLPDSHVKLPQK